MGLTGVGGIQTPNLAEVGSVEKALEKVYLTSELSRPVDVKDSSK